MFCNEIGWYDLQSDRFLENCQIGLVNLQIGQIGRLDRTDLPNILKLCRNEGNSNQILISEMSLPGIEVHIEQLLPLILGRLEKENPSKRRCKVAFVWCKCTVTSSVSVRFLYATYN